LLWIRERILSLNGKVIFLLEGKIIILLKQEGILFLRRYYNRKEHKGNPPSGRKGGSHPK
jgi:hypothetical protein